MEDLTINHAILKKNQQFIIFNKPCGIPVQDDKTGDKSLLAMAEAYCKKKLHLLHRIDRPASGIVLFGKTNKSLTSINQQFQDRKIQKTYLAVVGKSDIEKEGTITNFLKKNGKSNKSVLLNAFETGSKEAILKYDIISESDKYQLLKIDLLTGRHHQIRAQLAGIGCPIKGDVKYGFKRSNKDRSINLHAWKIQFHHPVTGEIEQIVAPLPTNDIWPLFETLI